ncbi:MAG: hypothetical protein ACLFRA_07290 [Alphaproteobacteria bacterium]
MPECDDYTVRLSDPEYDDGVASAKLSMGAARDMQASLAQIAPQCFVHFDIGGQDPLAPSAYPELDVAREQLDVAVSFMKVKFEMNGIDQPTMDSVQDRGGFKIQAGVLQDMADVEYAGSTVADNSPSAPGMSP